MTQEEHQDVINMLVNESARNLDLARQAQLLVAKLQRQLAELSKSKEEPKKED